MGLLLVFGNILFQLISVAHFVWIERSEVYSSPFPPLFFPWCCCNGPELPARPSKAALLVSIQFISIRAMLHDSHLQLYLCMIQHFSEHTMSTETGPVGATTPLAALRPAADPAHLLSVTNRLLGYPPNHPLLLITPTTQAASHNLVTNLKLQLESAQRWRGCGCRAEMSRRGFIHKHENYRSHRTSPRILESKLLTLEWYSMSLS